MSNDKIAAVILAAGASSRMDGVKKEYQKLPSGITVLETAIRTFSSVASVDIICIAACETTEAQDAITPECRELLKSRIVFTDGGATRCASALNALRALSRFNPGYVLIHDGARPFVSIQMIENIITAVREYGAVIPLLPLSDTPKECEASEKEQIMFIKSHLKRMNVGIAQTPQAFKYSEILRAHEMAASTEDEEFTDDAEVWGRFAGNVAVIPGDPANRKITFKEDLT
ncbi:MAG: 2-C-methyl-D-erythritol 4-phosphate cytidylyltransferase [Treponema sp.]|nr:2-C-methyl-D-erythritol 4-phosphate cytidylyltransferase [Treponema sp.]